MADKTTKKKTTSSTAKTAKTKATKTPVRSAKAKQADNVATKTAKIEKEKTQPVITSEPVNKSVRVRKSYFFTIIGIVLFVVVLYLLRNLVIAATVNDQIISRFSVIGELEKQGGKQALDSLITKSLITQEAHKRNIVISQGDIDSEMKKIQANLASQGQNLDQVLQLQGMTKEQLTDQIKLQKMIEKMVKPATVSDKEVDDYVAANKDSFPQTEDETTLKKTVKSQLQQQKLNEAAQKFLDGLRKNAKINYFVNY